MGVDNVLGRRFGGRLDRVSHWSWRLVMNMRDSDIKLVGIFVTLAYAIGMLVGAACGFFFGRAW